MSFHRGEVVRVDWPYSDRTGSKVRPAVVVQDDVLNQRIPDINLALISRTQRALETTEVEIDPAIETRRGLRYRSMVSCNDLLTIDQGLVVQILGQLSPTTMQKIDTCLRTALSLP